MNSPVGPSFKKNLLKFVLAGPVNSAQDPQKKRRCAPAFLFNSIQAYTKIS